MRNSVEKLLNQYSREQLVILYDQHHNIYKVADAIECDYATLVKVFKRLDIRVGKFLRQKKEVKKLSHLTKESLETLLRNNTIEEIAKLNNSYRGQIVARMREVGIAGNGKGPQHRNRPVDSIPIDIFKELLGFQGVLGLSKQLNLSQSAIRDRAHNLNIDITSGPRLITTSTEEYKIQARLRGVLGAQACPNKNTSIEIAVQEYLKLNNVNFELHPKIINLTVPDAFVAPDTCIYVDGCYWHGCSICKVSDKNSGLSYTKTHDNFVNKQLVKAGYKVIRIWEHDIKKGDFSALAPLLKK